MTPARQVILTFDSKFWDSTSVINRMPPTVAAAAAANGADGLAAGMAACCASLFDASCKFVPTFKRDCSTTGQFVCYVVRLSALRSSELPPSSMACYQVCHSGGGWSTYIWQHLRPWRKAWYTPPTTLFHAPPVAGVTDMRPHHGLKHSLRSYYIPKHVRIGFKHARHGGTAAGQRARRRLDRVCVPGGAHRRARPRGL